MVSDEVKEKLADKSEAFREFIAHAEFLITQRLYLLEGVTSQYRPSTKFTTNIRTLEPERVNFEFWGQNPGNTTLKILAIGFKEHSPETGAVVGNAGSRLDSIDDMDRQTCAYISYSQVEDFIETFNKILAAHNVPIIYDHELGLNPNKVSCYANADSEKGLRVQKRNAGLTLKITNAIAGIAATANELGVNDNNHGQFIGNGTAGSGACSLANLVASELYKLAFHNLPELGLTAQQIIGFVYSAQGRDDCPEDAVIIGTLEEILEVINGLSPNNPIIPTSPNGKGKEKIVQFRR